jgi:hypothetical protein
MEKEEKKGEEKKEKKKSPQSEKKVNNHNDFDLSIDSYIRNFFQEIKVLLQEKKLNL